MKPAIKKAARVSIRWGIAIAGIALILHLISFRDQAMVLNSHNRPVEVRIHEKLPDGTFRVDDPDRPDTTTLVDAGRLVNPPDRKLVAVVRDGQTRELPLLGMDLRVEATQNPEVLHLLVDVNGEGQWIAPSEAKDFRLMAARPRVEQGVNSLVRNASPWMLVLSVAIFPTTILLTSIRWRNLLRPLDIHLTFWQTLALNTVGMFYNTCIPTGSTGGDLVKAYYASQHTPFKARAILSVIVDRIIGLLVLIALGGSMALGYWATAANHDDPAARTCGFIGVMAVAIIGGLCLFLLICFQPRVKAFLQSERVLARLPMRKHIESAFEVMSIYRGSPMLVLWACLLTVPVHITVILSATLAGIAFNLPLSLGYYWIVVPVIVLMSALPISPQGAGVMEVAAITLMAKQGATPQQAVALTMCVRVVQNLWNLSGGFFVISGHYRAPKTETTSEPSTLSAGA